ncbi:MAG: hypothetical protein V4719_27310, partial [Planctomycetota bacterium]
MKIALFLVLAILGTENQLIEVDGDQELLKLLYTQQLANESLFPRGELNGRWTLKSTDGSRVQVVKSLVRWDGITTAWEYSEVDQRKGVNNNLPMESQSSRLISDKGDFIYRKGPSPQYEIKASRPMILDRPWQLRPQDIWFKYQGTVPWSNFLLREKFECLVERDGVHV